MNTGVEAVETAIKLARKWGYRHKGLAPDSAKIIVCRNNFHGRTTTVVGFSSEPQYRDGFGPYGDGFRQIDFGDIAALEAAITADTVAFLVEPIQAEAGVLVPPQGYLSAAARICRDRDVLFMLDEIQTGLGRSGRLFAFQREADAQPDVLMLGKALGGGLYPVSAVLASTATMSVIRPGDHGSTFGGNPLAAAVAREALAVILDEDFAGRAARLGEQLLLGLNSIGSRLVADVRGQGLLIGIQIEEDAGTARDFALRLLERGVLCKETHRQVLRLAPPLVVDEADIDWLLERIGPVLF
jgi:ornithine--oxo-acid transaminase